MNPLFDRAERDEEDRIVLRMGGKCPKCGIGPDVKYSGCGRVALWHRPARCLAQRCDRDAAARATLDRTTGDR